MTKNWWTRKRSKPIWIGGKAIGEQEAKRMSGSGVHLGVGCMSTFGHTHSEVVTQVLSCLAGGGSPL